MQHNPGVSKPVHLQCGLVPNSLISHCMRAATEFLLCMQACVPGGQQVDAFGMAPMWSAGPAPANQRQFSNRSDVSDCEPHFCPLLLHL